VAGCFEGMTIPRSLLEGRRASMSGQREPATVDRPSAPMLNRQLSKQVSLLVGQQQQQQGAQQQQHDSHLPTVKEGRSSLPALKDAGRQPAGSSSSSAKADSQSQARKPGPWRSDRWNL
jgi:hypothetical protein